ncbi:hypothetical protein DQ384_08315 [Sphaerisporangium album]|uniref:DUF1349 domain-containing protein n=1 Tax=Sphaerisporangium album TaxID=509200 RepID=A0A367FPD0_9ACTN|nr:hypothetical protein [Sphaerisporangium album]RCG31567.1 hypothetical protein DQ384_08315 [Sphaerisporangium album]
MPNVSEATPFAALVRREWANLRSRRRMIALTAVPVVTILLGLLLALGLGGRSVCSEGSVEVPCPTDPAGPDGEAVRDSFYFVHRPMGKNGSITVRMTSMNGIITYPPPDHDEIVPGLVPWAKAGVIIKDGTAQGSSYAALMVTGAHGVRMQHDFTHDTAGRPGGVSAGAPRWLRLTRSGDTITGQESADGTRWTRVGVVRLAGLPETVRVGLFAASPGDLTLRPVAIGAGLPQVRFTQATATFDHISLDGVPLGEWSRGSVGEMGRTDWEKYHRAPGLVESDGAFTVTGTGDMSPLGGESGRTVESNLLGLPISLLILIAVAARFLTAMPPHPATSATVPSTGRTLAAKAVVIGAVGLLAGLVAAAVVVPAGAMMLRANGVNVVPAPALTQLRVVAGVAVLLAVAAVFALALRALLRRTWAAILVAIATLVLPYLVAVVPLLPDDVSRWLLRLTPAAGFAAEQTLREYPQVVAHYAPSEGYFPLPWWAGLGVLCVYTAAVLALALRRRGGGTTSRARWR